MQSAKAKITETVKTYTELNPEEFGVFKEQMKNNREGLSDERFGTTNDSKYMRAVVEIPATLHDMITNVLSDEELEWFKQGGKDKHAGSQWFAKEFPVFRLPDLI